MPDYKADKISGWQRSPQVRIVNRYQSQKRIIYDEEILVNADGILLSNPVGGVEASVDELLALTIPRLNPLDDTVIGVVDAQTVEIDLYSIYRFLTDRRDALLDTQQQGVAPQ